MKAVKTLALALLLFSFPYHSDAQILENMESELGSAGSDGGGNDLWWLDLLLNVGFEPIYGVMFGFPNEYQLGLADYSPYPYFDGFSGNFMHIEDEGRGFQGQFYSHFQNNENTLSGGYFQLKLSPARFITLDVNHLRLFERRAVDNQKDQMSITNFNVHYNRVRHHKFHMWWGSGLMLLDRNTLYGSPTLTTGMDIFIKRPLSIHAEIQLGAPNGNITSLSQIRMQAHLERFLISAGFSGLQVGNEFEGSWSIGTGIYF